jgi:DNA-binding NarL/FixJ family response regulator
MPPYHRAAMVEPAPVQVLVVEDHPLYSDGLLALLSRGAPHLHCRVAVDAQAALYLLRAHLDVDLVLADLALPGGMDGLALLRQVGTEFPTAARVLTSGSDDPLLALRAQQAGLMGYLPKQLPALQWLQALEDIVAGNPWFPHAGAGPVATATAPSPRQLAVLQHLTAGLGNKEIARELGITERTVKYHLSELFGRLGASNRTQAVSRATQLGWLR